MSAMWLCRNSDDCRDSMCKHGKAHVKSCGCEVKCAFGIGLKAAPCTLLYEVVALEEELFEI